MADRKQVLMRLREKVDKSCQLKTSVRLDCNQFLQMELDTKGWSLDEAKIEEAARYDGYYVVVTNNLELDNAKRMLNIW